MLVRSRWLSGFLIMHWCGLAAAVTGGYLLLATEVTNQLPGMIGTSVAIGVGLLMMSPYPVVKAIQWMAAQQSEPQGVDKAQ